MKKLLILLIVALAMIGCRKDEGVPKNPLLGEWYLEYTMDSAKMVMIPYWEYQDVQPHLSFTENQVASFDRSKELDAIYGGGTIASIYSYSLDTIKVFGGYVNHYIKDDSLYVHGVYGYPMVFISCIYPKNGLYLPYWYCVYSKRLPSY